MVRIYTLQLYSWIIIHIIQHWSMYILMVYYYTTIVFIVLFQLERHWRAFVPRPSQNDIPFRRMTASRPPTLCGAAPLSGNLHDKHIHPLHSSLHCTV